MRLVRTLSIAVGALALGACYHATIDTGLTPSGQTIKQEWAASWLEGLVPPAIVETAAKCPNGVARVETQHSFLNMVASAITFGIYTPMTIEVQCAGGGRRSSLDETPTIRVPHGASATERAAAVREAVERAEATGAASYLFFE